MNWFVVLLAFIKFGKHKPSSCLAKFIYLIGVFFLCLTSAAQEPKHYNFTHYTGESGLISYQVNTTLQDEDGYIWIATNDGIQRYDGIRYKNFRYKSNDPSSIPFKSVLQILKDKRKNLWLLTMDGKVGIFDTKTFIFRSAAVKIKNEAQLKGTIKSKKLITDEYGNVFLLIEGKELATYNEALNEFSAAHNFIPLKPGWSITDFIQLPGTQKYWMSTKDSGMVIYNRASNHLSYSGNNIEQEKIIELAKGISGIEIIFFDKQSRAWLVEVANGFSNLYRCDINSQQPVMERYSFSKSIAGFHDVRDFLVQQDGTIWISGANLFARYLEKEKQFEQVYNGKDDDRGIEFVVLTNLMEDREHNIWVATANNGLYRFNPSQEFFTNVSHIDPATGKTGTGAPVTFMDDKDGSILAGVWGETTFRYDKNLKPIRLDIKGFPGNIAPPIISMSKSKKDHVIWMTALQGFYKYDQDSRTVKYYNPKQLHNRIREIEEDQDGNLWLGMQETGVFKWDAKKGAHGFDDGLTNFTAIPPVKIQKIMIDKKGYVWVGTFSAGAYVIDPKTDRVIMHFEQYAKDEKKLPEQSVTAILEYNDSLVMISTNTNIMMYNRLTQSLSYLGNSEKTSGLINSMEKDAFGHLWVASSAGLYRVTISSKIFVYFNRVDGIGNDNFILSASHVLPDGRILLGSTATMVVFDPKAINTSRNIPNCYITDFKVMNQSLRLDSLLQQKEVVLGPDDNSIIIDLSTLSFNVPVIIKYKLEGLDKEWKTADKSQELVYSYLPPGKYILHVYTGDDKGKQGDMPLQLFIRVSPPFWKTGWFFGLMLLLVATLLFWIDRERMKRKEAIQKMRSDIAEDLHEQLSLALGNINVLSEMARLKADKEPQKSKEFIEQIHTKSNNMINAMNDMLWNIHPENDSMHKALERLREHIDALRNLYAVQVDLLVDDNVEQLKLNMKLRQDIFWFLKSGITNMIRTGAVDCRVHIRLDKSLLVYTIEFDNTNVNNQQQSNLLQRQELDNRLKDTDAVLNVTTHSTKTIVELKIPVK